MKYLKLFAVLLVILTVICMCRYTKEKFSGGSSAPGLAGPGTSGLAGAKCQTNDDCLSGQCEGTAIIPGENPNWADLGPVNNSGQGTCD